MTVIALAGAGEIGASTATHLLRHDPALQLRAFDTRPEALARLGALDPARVTGVERRLDADAAGALDDCDLVLNTAGPFFLASNEIAELALASGCRYVDICDDVEGLEALVGLRDEASARGVCLLTGAGLSPGLSNLMARRLLDLHPDCDGIDIDWVSREEHPGGLAVLRHMLHMAVAPCPQWSEGRLEHVAGFVPQTRQVVPFPEPIGATELYNTPHPEPVTLPWAIERLQRVRCHGGLMPSWANAVFSSISRLGFGDRGQTVEVEGVEVDPVEVLWKVLWRRHEQRHADAPASGACGLRAVAYDGPDPVAEMAGVDDAGMARATGLGAAAIAAEALSDGLPPGLWGPEVMDAERALATFASMAAAAGAFSGGLNLVEPVAS